MSIRLAPTLAFGAAIALSTPSFADSIMVQEPWARETPASASTGAAYMVIINHGDTSETLVGGESDVAERIEVHAHEMTDGVMKMRQVEGGVDLPAGGDVALEPGGLHLMLMGLQAPLAEGERFSLTLVFESGMRIETEVDITDIRGPARTEGHETDHSGHGANTTQ